MVTTTSNVLILNDNAGNYAGRITRGTQQGEQERNQLCTPHQSLGIILNPLDHLSLDQTITHVYRFVTGQAWHSLCTSASP